MKAKAAILFSFLIAGVSPAQESPTPTPAPSTPPPESAATPEPAQSPQPGSTLLGTAGGLDANPLFTLPETEIPETMPPELLPPPSIPDAISTGQAKFGKSKTAAEQDEIQKRVRFRNARTKADQDPKVIEWREKAGAAKTDPEKRDALRRYYAALFERILKVDNGIVKEVEQHKLQAEKDLEQNRVRSSDPEFKW